MLSLSLSLLLLLLLLLLLMMMMIDDGDYCNLYLALEAEREDRKEIKAGGKARR